MIALTAIQDNKGNTFYGIDGLTYDQLLSICDGLEIERMENLGHNGIDEIYLFLASVLGVKNANDKMSAKGKNNRVLRSN